MSVVDDNWHNASHYKTHARVERPIHYIDTQPQLDELVGLLAEAKDVFFDTEFLREKTYHPQLCLMQLCIGTDIYVIDPLADIDLNAFWPAFFQANIVLHSGRQDIEVVNICAQQLPGLVYDTQIAAGLVGMPAQIGYARLVEAICDVQLDKAHTRTDWSRRPLAKDVLEYAADDVKYLPAITDHLNTQLDALGRREWVLEDCAAQLEPTLYSVDTASAWRRIKAAARLPEEIRARLVLFGEWRETTAINSNRPRQWIIRDEALINIAFDRPMDGSALNDIQGVSERFASRYAEKIAELLQAELPKIPAALERPDDAEKARAKAIGKKVREIATEMNIEAEILAPSREIKRAARGDDDLRALRGWREAVVGDAIRSLMP